MMRCQRCTTGSSGLRGECSSILYVYINYLGYHTNPVVAYGKACLSSYNQTVVAPGATKTYNNQFELSRVVWPSLYKHACVNVAGQGIIVTL